MVPGWLLLWQFTAKAVVEQKLVEFCPCGVLGPDRSAAMASLIKPYETIKPVCDRFGAHQARKVQPCQWHTHPGLA